MTAPTATTDIDLTKLEWHFPEWLAQYGPLNPMNVLDYLEHSPFWDPTCNNSVLKMQTQYNALEALQEHLKQMTGVEFVVVRERWPALFVIRKQHRRSPTEVVPLAVYHVVHGRVYQSPDMLTLLNTRMLTSLHHLETAMKRARELARFQPAQGYTWCTKEAAQMEQERATRQDISAASVARQMESNQFRINIDRMMDMLASNAGALPSTSGSAQHITMGGAGSTSGRLTLAPAHAALSKVPSTGTATNIDAARKKKKGEDVNLSNRKKKKYEKR